MQHSLVQNESVQRGTDGFPLELYHVDCQDPRFQMAYHWHMEVEIIRILAGSFRLTRNQQEHLLQAGSMVFLSSGALHGGDPSTDCVYECIVFDRNLLPKKDVPGYAELQQLLDGEAEIRPVLRDESPLLWDRLAELFRCAADPSPGSRLMAQGLLMVCFGLLLQRADFRLMPGAGSRVNRKTEQMKRVLARIERDYTEPLTLNDLAAEAGMSPKYFCHFFQQLTRRTPIDYLNDYRIEQACCMLLADEGSVTDIAFRCGFNDLSYFIRIFRKYKGISPGKYEKQLRQQRSAPEDAG